MTEQSFSTGDLSLGSYVSCIKINGVSILPPILTEHHTEEMQYYRKLAIEVEKRLSSLKTICSKPKDNDVAQENTEDEVTSPSEDENYNPDGEGATLMSSTFASYHSNATVVDNSDKTHLSSPTLVSNVDYNLNENPNRHIAITSEDDSIPERDINCTKSPTNTCQSGGETDLIDALNLSLRSSRNNVNGPSDQVDGLQTKKSITGSLQNVNQIQSEQPGKLQRQNSYTLDNPSPMLLNYLKKQSENSVECNSMSEISIKSKRRKSWDLELIKDKHPMNRAEVSPTSKRSCEKRQIVQNGARKIGARVSQTKSSSKRINGNRREDLRKEEPTPKCKAQRATKLVYRAQNLESVNSLSETQSSPYLSPTRDSCDENVNESMIEELFEKMKIQQALQMDSLLERQKREQLMLQQIFEEQNMMFYQKLQNLSRHKLSDFKPEALLIDAEETHRNINNNITSTIENTKKYINSTDTMLKRSRLVLASPRSPTRIPKSKLRNTSPEGKVSLAPSKAFNSPTRRTLRLSPRRYAQDDIPNSCRTNDTLADVNMSLPIDDNGNNEEYHHGLMDSRSYTRVPGVNANGKPAKHSKERKPTQKELDASTRITAACRGYIVRRLLRTERVRATVGTLRDALCCALELHKDKDKIRGADIDLHRRLIQQITAACYDLHDTFITSSPRQRCEIIAQDRERLKSKMVKKREPNTIRIRRLAYTQTGSDKWGSQTNLFHPPTPTDTTSLLTQSSHEIYSLNNSPGQNFTKKNTRRRSDDVCRRPWR